MTALPLVRTVFVAASWAWAASIASADGPAREPEQIFASTCGWCHSKGGREAGKGPRLMGTSLTDAEIAYRIRKGKQGYMPAFDGAFSDAEVKALVAYIRNLKP
jgi:mono/diheme cytochrome c family protein